ncbi:hypothetical protein NMG60_11033925 [Bertholletia excelsa]
MKTISGKVTSTKPISVSKAARVLSNFVNAENGASQAVSVYLGRASAAFNDLVQFHKELKASKLESKQKKHEEESINSEGLVKYEQNQEDVAVQEVEDSAGQRHKKKNKLIEGALRGEVSLAKKKRKNEVYDGELVGSAEQDGAKKKKRKIENKQ